MRPATLVLRNLVYYWRTNLAVVSGVATAVAVLAGALLVGDSVRASLRDLFLLRLGRADYVISGPGFFRGQLADDLATRARFSAEFAAACPLIALEGLVTQEKSGRRASGVQVYGVDERFWDFHGLARPGAPGVRDILMSPGLAQELDGGASDTVLVRVEAQAVVPAGSLHGRKSDTGRTLRGIVREVLPASGLGEFSIRPQQGAVRAVFVSLSRLQVDLQQPDKVNAILVSEKSPQASNPQALEALLREAFRVEDLNIRLRALRERGALSLSAGGIVGDTLAGAAQAAAASLGMRAAPVFTYLANTIRGGRREIPYSLVTAMDLPPAPGPAPPPPMVLNDWAARDLGVRLGERITLEYYVWREEGRLDTETAEFQLTAIVPLQGSAADRDLAPDFPGITDIETFRDWDPPFPIDLGRVRPRDEQYWEQYRTTPKAFLPLAAGQQLWQSRYGKLTSLRVFPPAGTPPGAALEAYRQALEKSLDPLRMGFLIYPARREGLEASRGATDFGEYFVYFSFFLMASALLLAGLFFKLGVEQRLGEIGALEAMGFRKARIRALFLCEGFILSAAGGLLGVVGALAYGALMMQGLRTWWVDAVGTTLLTLHVDAISLILGAAGGLLAALFSIAWTLRSLRLLTPRQLLAKTHPGHSVAEAQRRTSLLLSLTLCLGGIILLFLASAQRFSQVAGFFLAGTFVLGALLSFLWSWISRHRRRLLRGHGLPGLVLLGFRCASERPGRSILAIALIASATFVIVAVDAFRRDGPASSLDKTSGTGGFALLAESLLALHHDPNDSAGKEALNLGPDEIARLEKVTFVNFRLRPGDDSSCLNLYQPRNPRILAVARDFVRSGRFAFQDSLAETPEERQNPWLLLEKPAADGAIPAIADATSMAYVLHLRLGEEYVLGGDAGRPVRLRLVAALRDSVFQKELLISEKNFPEHFTEAEGFRFFLIDTPPQRAEEATAVLEEALADYGFDVQPASERLARFHRVENTYLATFQSLGILGLLLGTLGLAAVMLRNVWERRRELALLRAVGYRPGNLAFIVVAENVFLLGCGLFSGSVSALLAIAPAMLSRGGPLPAAFLGLLLLSVLLSGLAASLAAVAAVVRSPLIPALRAE